MHIIGPQLGLTQPGMTIVCGDSHTSTHGAFGALAMGIGTSEVEHVLATQTLPLRPFKTMAVNVDGELPAGVSAKDIILAVIAKIGTGGGQGHVIEYRGSAIESLSMEGRMTICNMSIEAGARAGMVAPDETTYEFLRGRPHAPTGAEWDAAVAAWDQLRTDDDAEFDTEVYLDAATLSPFVTWGTNPGQGVPLSAVGARPRADARRRRAAGRRESIGVHGPSARHADARYRGGRRLRRFVHQRSHRGSARGGRRVCVAARWPTVCGCWSCRARCGCARRPNPKASARYSRPPAPSGVRPAARCVSGMNPDQLAPGERCASTSNRNFEGRQGKGGRTHLVSPAVAAATAVRGTLSSPADLS